MKVRAEMNIIDKGSLVAAGDVYLEEKIVIHQVKLIATKHTETGADMWVVVMPDKKKGDAWDKVVYVKDKTVYRPTNGFDNFDGANYDLALWVAYYNFLRPHKLHRYKRPLVEDDIIRSGDNMPAKWQLMIFLGQKTIKKMQETVA